jgi:hypothetical protein
MRIETPKERIERKCRSAVYLAEAHERAMAEARKQEDGFIKICDQNHREAMERDAQQPVTVIPVKPPAFQEPEQIEEEKRTAFMNGISLGALAIVLVLVLLKTAGAI